MNKYDILDCLVRMTKVKVVYKECKKPPSDVSAERNFGMVERIVPGVGVEVALSVTGGSGVIL